MFSHILVLEKVIYHKMQFQIVSQYIFTFYRFNQKHVSFPTFLEGIIATGNGI